MSWIIEEKGFKREKTELNGSKFLLGNGYMGYRGTMEEFAKDRLVACNLLGLYDQAGDKWREPVNAPNGFFSVLRCDDVSVDILEIETEEHAQCLNIKSGLHQRKSTFIMPGGNCITVGTERFLSLVNVHLMCMKYTFSVSKKCRIVINTGIDGDVWDINGPHLAEIEPATECGLIVLNSRTGELGCRVSVAEGMESNFTADEEIVTEDKRIIRKIALEAQPDEEYAFCKYVAVYTDNDGVEDASGASVKDCLDAIDRGYEELAAGHAEKWSKLWEASDVKIGGDDEAQLALRYSIYHLLSIAPTHSDRASIPARGLSGQVYKGAVFWDTEMFMLPFFICTNPQMAKNLVRYRVHTLDGARRKAAEYGYRGAYYAWESQDTGDDACTLFNVTDVFTGRPVRTYFRDKQIHISADVVYGIWQYYKLTGDEDILLEGGAEVILECARFMVSYAYFKKDRNRYEILDVTGPDEYHERVNNNAFTNVMVKHTLEVAQATLKHLKNKYKAEYMGLMRKLDYETELENIREMKELLYIPQPDVHSLVIEQFDGYHRLEDIGLKELKNRIIHPDEYLGGGNGLAAATGIIKQADTVLMLNLFKDRYSNDVKKANWDYYEPRTEHGSSLSSCVYALLAADTGNPEWAYRYFMKTATIDLTGESKQYAGTIYIGGTHPAANGGAWMAAVLGFGGVSFDDEMVSLNPRLPSKWETLKFTLILRGQVFNISIDRNFVILQPEESNTRDLCFNVGGKAVICQAGRSISVNYK